MSVSTKEIEAEQTEQTEQTEQVEQVEQTEPDRTALEGRVKEGLSSLFGDEDDAPTDTPDEESADEESVDEDQNEDQDEESEGDSEAAHSEDTAEEAAVEGQSDPDTPTLPDTYRRSLKAYGWPDEDIDQNLELLGDKFIESASKIHANRNAELQTWAAAGRQARGGQVQEGGSPDQPAAQQSAPQPSAPVALQPVDAEQLKEKYGEDELVDAIVGPVNATVSAINSIIPSLEAGQQAAQQAEADRAAREVEGFFASGELKPYAELYGDASKGLTDPQVQTRHKMLDVAFDLVLGASELRNQQLSLGEALGLAHGLTSTEFKETAVRQGITKKARDRSKGISLKPTRRGGGPLNSSGTPGDRTELESRTKARMKAVFG